MSERPADILLPEGWDWDRVEAARAKRGVPDHMVPVTVVPGIAVAWITINAAREDQRAADTSGEGLHWRALRWRRAGRRPQLLHLLWHGRRRLMYERFDFKATVAERDEFGRSVAGFIRTAYGNAAKVEVRKTTSDSPLIRVEFTDGKVYNLTVTRSTT